MTWLEQFITRLEKAGFKPYQPRVPAGNRDGGQWSSTGTSRLGPTSQRARSINRTTRPKPIKKPKPITRLPSGKPVTMRFPTQAYAAAVAQPKPTASELERLYQLDPPLEPAYPVEAILGLGAQTAARAAAQQVTNALRAMRLAIQAERVRRLEQEIAEIENTARQGERTGSNRPGPDPRKTETAFKRQLEEKGLSSLKKSRRSIETQLRIHEEKLKRDSMNGGRTSSIEREIRGFRMQIEVLNKLIEK